MNVTDLSSAQLRRAASIKERITALEKELGHLLSAAPQGRNVLISKRKMSAAARRKIGAAQRARWTKARGRKSSIKPAHKSRRKMGAAAKARLAAIARERWARVKASGKKRL